MVCCTSAPPTIFRLASRASTGQACGATKQILGLAATVSTGRPSMAAPLRIAPAGISGLGVRRPPGELAVHHADGEPQEGELRPRQEARARDAGDEEGEQRRRGALVE